MHWMISVGCIAGWTDVKREVWIVVTHVDGLRCLTSDRVV